MLALGAPGRVTVTATAGSATAEMLLDMEPNPAAGIDLTPDRSTARTGDVTHLTARVTDAEGRPPTMSRSASASPPSPTT